MTAEQQEPVKMEVQEEEMKIAPDPFLEWEPPETHRYPKSHEFREE